MAAQRLASARIRISPLIESLCVTRSSRLALLMFTFQKAKTTTLKHSNGKRNHIVPYETALTQCTLNTYDTIWRKGFRRCIRKNAFSFLHKSPYEVTRKSAIYQRFSRSTQQISSEHTATAHPPPLLQPLHLRHLPSLTTHRPPSPISFREFILLSPRRCTSLCATLPRRPPRLLPWCLAQAGGWQRFKIVS